MHGELPILVLILIFGCAAFFFGVVYLIGRAIAWLAKSLASLVGWSCDSAVAPGRPARMGAQQRRVCPRSGCHRVEYRHGARYCSQCGARLI
jgi:hypothetical protein